MKNSFYYGTFFVMALALHAWLLLPAQGTNATKPANAAPEREFHIAMREMAELLASIPEVPEPEPPKVEPPKPVEPEPPKKEEPKPEPPVVETEAAPPPPEKVMPKLEEPKPEPPPPPPPAAEPPAPATKGAPEKFTETPIEAPKAEAQQDPAPAPAPRVEAAPAPKVEPPPAPKVEAPAAPRTDGPGPASGDAIKVGPAPKVEPAAPSAPRAGVATTKEYRQYLAKEMPKNADYTYIPKIRFGDSSEAENREIMRYFGMELIAFPENQKFYVYIDPEIGLFSKSADFDYMKNFSNRVIYRSSPYFDGLRERAEKKNNLAAGTLHVAQLLKPASAAYLAWKEVETAKRAGVELRKVATCEASFAKTPFGVWIVRIDALVMQDGTTKPVEDFEWSQVK